MIPTFNPGAWADSPPDLPAELAGWDGPIRDGLGVGSAGKEGVLDLTLARLAGTTRLCRQYQRAPLYLYRPMYLDPGRPDMAFVFLLQAGDGLVQGDRYRIDIDCKRDAAVHVTTQAATKVFAANQNFASQLVNLRAGAGVLLEYLPEPVMPYRDSRLFQRTRVIADPDSTVIAGETLLPGRVAHGERHAYASYWAETEFMTPDRRLLFADLLRFEPTRGRLPNSLGLIDTHDFVATLYVITRHSEPHGVVTLLRSALADCADVVGGASELPGNCGAAVRMLGPDSRTVRTAMLSAWNAVRLALIGTPAPDLRKG